MALSQSSHTEKSQDLDIVDIILEDHKMLKELLETLKNPDIDLDERRDAYAEFAPLLATHSKPEEETLYAYLKTQDDDLRTEGFEGEVEHGIADQLLEEIEREEDEDVWSAKVKVLAELVEHHIKEEESNVLPDFRKHSAANVRSGLAEEFIDLKTELLIEGGDDSKPEAEIEVEEEITAH